MKKKILSLVLVVAMLASMLVLAPVSGATEKSATVKTSNVVAVGDTVAVDVTITSDMPVYGYTLAYEYDASKLHFEGITFAIAGGVENYDAKDGPAYTEVTHSGPYEIFGWTYNAKATTAAKNPIDATDGAVVATLNFTILDGASGDAYVAIRNLKRANGTAISELYTGMDGSTVTSKYVGDDIEYLESKVTILPEGYSTESTLPPVNYITQDDVDNEILQYTFNEEMDGVIITGYNKEKATYSGILVLPSTLVDNVVEMTEEEYPVVGIAAEAFSQETLITAFVIPETVNEIAPLAFFKCAATDYYVMNDECVISSNAMGMTANSSKTKFYIYNKVLVDGTTTSTTTIHGGANAKAYAETVVTASTAYKATCFSYSSSTAFPTENTLTFNDTKYYFTSGTEVTLPGMVEDANGRLVVEWNVGVVGKTITITEDIVLEPAKTIAKPQTSTEVGLKLADSWKGLSMRFKATFGVADYDTLVEVAGEGGSVALGMLITPARYVSYAGAFTKEALAEFEVGDKTYSLGEDAYVDVALNGYFSKTDDEYTFAARLQNFSDTTLAKNPDFAAVMYATVTTADGATFTVYGDFNFAANNSVLDVAENTSTEGQTDTIKGAVANLIKKLNGEEV